MIQNKRELIYGVILITMLIGNVAIITASVFNYQYEVSLEELHTSLLYLTLLSLIEVLLIFIIIEGALLFINRLSLMIGMLKSREKPLILV
jgi:hypothetical protein